MRAVFDTNILVDFLQGVEAARTEIGLYPEPGISLVTWIEVMVGARRAGEEPALRSFLARFRVYPLTAAVAERAVALRKERRLRLPDAIIWATADVEDAILVTCNTRDFPDRHPGIRVPYQI